MIVALIPNVGLETYKSQPRYAVANLEHRSKIKESNLHTHAVRNLATVQRSPENSALFHYHKDGVKHDYSGGFFRLTHTLETQGYLYQSLFTTPERKMQHTL